MTEQEPKTSKGNYPAIRIFIKPHCFIEDFNKKYEKAICSIFLPRDTYEKSSRSYFLPRDTLEEEISNIPLKKFSNKEEILNFLNDRVTGCTGRIGVLCEELLKLKSWFGRKEYLKEIEEIAFGLSALYVARDIIEGDRMSKKGYSLYHQSIENFLKEIGYVKDDKSQGGK